MLLDRSGSMASIKADIEGGFNAFVADQRSQPGRVTLTLAQFDDHYDVIHDRVPLADVPPLDLTPRGMTALLDSIARLVTTTGEQLAALPEDQRPDTVIVGILTDGMENASREWTHPAIKALIEQQTTRYRWEFLYMGANQDAIEVGTGLGISANRSLTYSTSAGQDAMAATSNMVSGLRSTAAGERAKVGYSMADREAANR